MSRTVFVVQRVGFALAVVLGIMPPLMTAVRNAALYGLIQWDYPALGALILVFTVLVASRIAQLQWQHRSKKTRFLQPSAVPPGSQVLFENYLRLAHYALNML